MLPYRMWCQAAGFGEPPPGQAPRQEPAVKDSRTTRRRFRSNGLTALGGVGAMALASRLSPGMKENMSVNLIDDPAYAKAKSGMIAMLAAWKAQLPN